MSKQKIKNLGTYFPPEKKPADLVAIKVITNNFSCEKAVLEIRKQTEHSRIIGLDTEWRIVEGERTPVSLLQLATSSGSCFLMRLCCMEIPRSLRMLLSDTTILKIGCNIAVDVENLKSDYNMQIYSFMDIGHIGYNIIGFKGLKKMSAESVGIEYGESKVISCSNWNDNQLSYIQQLYAALDAFLPIKILEYCASKIVQRNSIIISTEEMKFNYMLKVYKSNIKYTIFPKMKPELPSINKNKLYLMLGPSDEYIGLCTPSMKRRYVKLKLAYEKIEYPYKLFFYKITSCVKSLSDKSVEHSDVGSGCVLCSNKDSMLTTFIVPTAYVKYITTDIRSEYTHKISILCVNCYSKYNSLHSELRLYLSILCSAPLHGMKTDNLTKIGYSLRALARSVFYPGFNEEEKERKKEVIGQYVNEPLDENALYNLANMKSSRLQFCELVVNYFTKRGKMDEFYQIFIDEFESLRISRSA